MPALGDLVHGIPMAAFEIPLGLLLLFRGVRPPA